MKGWYAFRVNGKTVTFYANSIEEAKKILQIFFGDAPTEFLRMDLIV